MESPPEAVKVTVRPQKKILLSSTQDSLHILFSLVTQKQQEGQEAGPGSGRPPIELAIVLDKSGSMFGEKLDFAKKAAVQVIQLLEPTDRLHFIVFCTSVCVVFVDGDLGNKDLLIEKVNAIEDGGSTNLIGGLNKAFELLQGSNSRLRRVFLFSDGEADRKEGIFEQIDLFLVNGVTVSSFGIGDHFDEDLMRGIAERGSGDYFYMQYAESIPGYVHRALHSLTNLIGINGIFKISTENGATLKQIYGPENPTDVLFFGDIQANNQRNIIVEIVVVPPDDTPLWKAVTWELTYEPLRGPLPLTRQQLQGAIHFTTTPHIDLLDQEDPEVQISVKIKEVGKKDQECKKLLDQGKISEVISIKKSVLEELKEFHEKDGSGRISILIDLGEKALAGLDTLQKQMTSEEQESPGGDRRDMVFYQKFGRFPPKKKVLQINRSAARKHFDSGSYFCQKDNSFNWESSSVGKK